MLKHIFGKDAPGGLLRDAFEELYRMLELETGMFRAACDVLFQRGRAEMDIAEKDKDINVGERMVRRLVFEHLTVNPHQDLPASLTLIGIVHDVERIGDYIKNLLELSELRPPELQIQACGQACAQIYPLILPLFEKTLAALRASDPEIARDVMQHHREVKRLTDQLIENAMKNAGTSRETLYFTIASRFLRRISAHLSNIASSIANPFDKLGRNEETHSG